MESPESHPWTYGNKTREDLSSRFWGKGWGHWKYIWVSPTLWAEAHPRYCIGRDGKSKTFFFFKKAFRILSRRLNKNSEDIKGVNPKKKRWTHLAMLKNIHSLQENTFKSGKTRDSLGKGICNTHGEQRINNQNIYIYIKTLHIDKNHLI